MRSNLARAVLTAVCVGVSALPGQAGTPGKTEIEPIVAHTIQPLMARYGIPGMAVGIIVGDKTYVYPFGVASKATGTPVTDDTLFEIGSVSKTFTATLASYAQVQGRLSLSDKASQYMPALRGSSFDEVDLLQLGTHTSGGLPLQFPDAVTTDDEMIKYFRDWKPAYRPGTVRLYSNPSIGLLGLLVARRMNGTFDAVMERKLFPAFGLHHTYLVVPQSQMAHYAQGYTQTDAPIRIQRAVLAAEAYGIETNAGDLARFVGANMGLIALDDDLQRAVTATHTGYYRLGAMTQDLIWEQYAYPVALKDLLAGNSRKVLLEATPVVASHPPAPPRTDVLINKTGSTNGFGTYVAFVPGKKIGIVLLANKSYPVDARVTAAYEILTRLSADDSRR